MLDILISVRTQSTTSYINSFCNVWQLQYQTIQEPKSSWEFVTDSCLVSYYKPLFQVFPLWYTQVTSAHKRNCSRWSKRETHCWNAFREAENHLGLYLIVPHVLWELFVLAWHTHTSACNTGRNNFDSHLMSLLYCCRHAGICFEVDNLLPTEQFQNNLPERTVSKHWRFHP